MSNLRHIAIDSLGSIYEVTNLLDRFGNTTDDPALASTCVVLVNGHHIAQDADDVPIHTVN